MASRRCWWVLNNGAGYTLVARGLAKRWSCQGGGSASRAAKGAHLQPPRAVPGSPPMLHRSAHSTCLLPPHRSRQVAPELKAYYDRLLAKYIPHGSLRW